MPIPPTCSRTGCVGTATGLLAPMADGAVRVGVGLVHDQGRPLCQGHYDEVMRTLDLADRKAAADTRAARQYAAWSPTQQQHHDGR